MRKLCLALVMACAASSVYAQVQRTYVSGSGIDSGTCATNAPCRSFQYAFGQTAAGGDIVALERAGYNTINITHSVNIVLPPGIMVPITDPTSVFGIIINAASTYFVHMRVVRRN